MLRLEPLLSCLSEGDLGRNDDALALCLSSAQIGLLRERFFLGGAGSHVATLEKGAVAASPIGSVAVAHAAMSRSLRLSRSWEDDFDMELILLSGAGLVDAGARPFLLSDGA